MQFTLYLYACEKVFTSCVHRPILATGISCPYSACDLQGFNTKALHCYSDFKKEKK